MANPNRVEPTPQNLMEFNLIGRDQEEIAALAKAMIEISSHDTPIMVVESVRIRVDRILFGGVARLMQLEPEVIEMADGYKEYRMQFNNNETRLTIWTT